MPATARAAKSKDQKGSPDLAGADLAIEERLRALILVKLSEMPLGWIKRNQKSGRQTLEAFLAGRSPLLVEDLGTFAKLLKTTPAALLAEALGSGALLAQVKLLEQLIPTLKQWQAEVEEWRSAITPSPREDAMLEGAEEQDEATEIRALLECISRQHLAGTIAAAQEVAGWQPKGKKPKEET